MSREKGDWFQTFSGGRFWPMDPDPGDICIQDIAHHLSMICRFGGASSDFYSVAQHSIHVSQICKRYPLHGLLHDAAEAYVGDMIRPLKHGPGMEAYRDAEKTLQAMIWERFGLRQPDAEIDLEIDDADNVMLFTEARDLVKCEPNSWRKHVEPSKWIRVTPTLSPKEAEEAFLNKWRHLFGTVLDYQPDWLAPGQPGAVNA